MKAPLLAMIRRHFDVLDVYEYGELEDGGSLFVVAQKR